MNKQLKNVPEDNKGLKKLPTDVRNRMGFLAKGGMAAKGMAKGGAVMAKGGSVKMAKGGAVMAKGGSVKMAGGGMTKGYKAGGMTKGYKAGGMTKGYKIGGMTSKGGTKGGVSGGTKVTRADGIAKRGKTKGRKV